MTTPVSADLSENNTPIKPTPKTENPYGDLLKECLSDPGNITAIDDVQALKYLQGHIDTQLSKISGKETVGDLYENIVILKGNIDIKIERHEIKENHAQVKLLYDLVEKEQKAGTIPNDLAEKWKSIINDCKIVITQENMKKIIQEKTERLEEIASILPVAIETLKTENLFTKSKSVNPKAPSIEALKADFSSRASIQTGSSFKTEPKKDPVFERPKEVQKILSSLKIGDLDALEDYRDGLKDPSRSYQDGERLASFLSIDKSVIGASIRELDRGTYGHVDEHLKLTQEGLNVASTFTTSTAIGKHDVTPGSTEKEYLIFKKFWNELNDDERKHIVELIAGVTGKLAATAGEVFEVLYIERFDGNLTKAKNLSIEQKAQIIESVFKSLEIFINHGYVLTDIKLKNMLFKLTEHGYHGVLSDYGSLIDFKEIQNEPTVEKLEALIKNMIIWSPQDLHMGLYLNALNELKNIRDHFDKDDPQLIIKLNMTLSKLNRLMDFCVNASLYRLITNESAYTDVKTNRFSDCPKSILYTDKKKYLTMYEFPGIDYAKIQRQKLEQAGCPPELLEKLLNGLSTANLPKVGILPERSDFTKMENMIAFYDRSLENGLFAQLKDKHVDAKDSFNFNELLQNPTIEGLNDLHRRIDTYNLQSVDIKEYAELKSSIELLIKNYETCSLDEMKDILEGIQNQLQAIHKFNFACGLFELITNKQAYPTILVERNGITEKSLTVENDTRYPNYQEELLRKANCPDSIIEKLVFLMHPENFQRFL